MLSKSISIEAKRIEVVKAWPEPKSVQDIQVFLGFANFYRRFIQGFSRMAAPLTSMLKTTVLPERSTSERLEVSDSEVDRFGVGENGVEHAKKSGKLSKSGNQKAKKRLSLEIWLIQEKSCQKVGIQLILTLKRMDQSF